MRPKVCVLILALGAACFGQSSFGQSLTISGGLYAAAASRTETRLVELPGHFYIVSYEIVSNGLVTVPAVYGGENKPHHAALVSVFEIANGARHQIGQTFNGQFVDGGCFEDDPESMVERSYGEVPRDVKAAIESQREKAQLEAQPLFQERGGSLTVTAKGQRDLKEVRIGDSVVWKNDSRAAASAKEGISVLESTGRLFAAHGCIGSDGLVSLTDVPCAARK